MEPMSRRELELRMKVVADTTEATKSIQKLGKETQDAQRKAEAALDQRLAGIASGSTAAARLMGERVAGMEQAAYNRAKYGAALGGVMNAMPSISTLGMGGAAFALAQQTMGKVGQVGAALQDPYTTNFQTGRELLKALPLGETGMDMIDSLSGRKAGMEMANVESQQRMAEQRGRLQLEAFNRTYRPQQAGLEARAAGLAGARPVLEGYTDRSTAEGEKAFRDRQRMLPLERESAKAEREAAAAAAQRTAANKELMAVERRQLELAAERKKVQRELDEGSGSGTDRQRRLYRMSEINAETQAQAEARRAAKEQTVEAAKAEAQARAAAEMVGVRKLQTEAAGLEEDAGRASGLARKLGTMNTFQRQRAAQDVQLALQYGPEAVGPSRLQNAMAVAPEAIGKLVEKTGAGAAEFRTIAAAEGIEGTPEELRKRAAAKRDEAAGAELKAEATLARATAEAGRDLGKVVADEMKKLVAAAADEIRQQLRIARGAK